MAAAALFDEVALAAAAAVALEELADVADAPAAPDEAAAAPPALVELADVAEAAGSVVVAGAAAPPASAAAVAVGAPVISRQPVGRLALIVEDPAAAKYLSMLGRLRRLISMTRLLKNQDENLHIDTSVLVDSIDIGLSSVRALVDHLL